MQLGFTEMNGVKVRMFEGFAVAPNGEKFAVKGDDFSSYGTILVRMPDRSESGFSPKTITLAANDGEEIEIEMRIELWSEGNREHYVSLQVP